MRVLALSMVYFTIVTATYGITFFLPQIVKGLGGSDMRTGLLTAAPYVIGTIGMLVWSQSSDRHKERKWHFIIACLLGAAGLIAAGALGSTLWRTGGDRNRDDRNLLAASRRSGRCRANS